MPYLKEVMLTSVIRKLVNNPVKESFNKRKKKLKLFNKT